MNLRERDQKIMWLKERQHYSLDFYNKRSNNQLLAMYYKELKKPLVKHREKTEEVKKSNQLMFDFDNQYQIVQAPILSKRRK